MTTIGFGSLVALLEWIKPFSIKLFVSTYSVENSPSIFLLVKPRNFFSLYFIARISLCIINYIIQDPFFGL